MGKNKDLLKAVASAVANLDPELWGDKLRTYEIYKLPGRDQLRELLDARAALLEKDSEPIVLTVEGEYYEKAETLLGNEFDTMYVDDTPLCVLVDDVVKARWDKGYASYGRVTLSITFHEAEARNA